MRSRFERLASREACLPSQESTTMTEELPVAETAPPGPENRKSKRGFAVMDRDRVRELARRGGAAAHQNGRAHEFSSEEARAAGRKGGLAAHASRTGAADAKKTGSAESKT
jgi:general stress protein YciG